MQILPHLLGLFFFLRPLLFQCGKSLFLSPEVLPLMGGEVEGQGQQPNIHYQTNTGAFQQVIAGDAAFSLALS